MRNKLRVQSLSLWLSLILTVLCASGALAQSTRFTYQGKLTDGGTPANTQYDMQFKLFDTMNVGSGTQLGSTVTNENVQVSNGVFTVQLDFSPGVFDGSARYLEVGVRPVGVRTLTPCLRRASKSFLRFMLFKRSTPQIAERLLPPVNKAR